MEFEKMSPEQAENEYRAAQAEYNSFKAKNLKLDMSRGKPDKAQLSLSKGLMNCISDDMAFLEDGTDCRNYGLLDGIPEAKRLIADLLELEPSEVVVGGNSSLSLMFDNISSNMSHGVRDGEPWQKQGKIKFLCPSPGYDRHFAICEYFHIEMIPIKLTEAGPDMDTVERLVAEDELIKGIWCVPVYSNPTGIVYSDDTVRRLAALKPKAKDFRIYWDNAYFVHSLTEECARIPNILREAEKYGNVNMPLIFCSFSKISYAGASISAMCASKSNVDYIKKRLGIQTIGPDKINQLRHVKFFGNAENVRAHMKKHATIIAPKFNAVLSVLEEGLGGTGLATWTKPEGGYFISVDVPEGCAKRVVQLCAEAGVKLTEAGATWPYGKDPFDSNIRIAPTLPPISELETAMKLFTVCVRLAWCEKHIGR